MLVVSLALILGCNGQAKHKSDEDLIANFRNHRKDFEQLRAMGTADTNLVRVDMRYMDPEDLRSAGVSADRIAEYRKLFRRAGCPQGLLSSPRRAGIWFLASAHGLLNRGSSKGYCYATKPPPVIVTNTANYRPPNGEGYEIYRHIEGSWYLFLEHGG
jgi:hypothetical protein